MPLPKPASVAFNHSTHDVHAFDCGQQSLNTWIRNHADRARQMGTAHTFVFARQNSIIAYYSLTASSIVRSTLSPSMAHGSPDQVPAWLIARFAVSLPHQGTGIGGALMVDALTRLIAASESGPAARFVIVDPIDHGASLFYEKFGFRRIPDSSRMIMKMSTARQLVMPG